MGHLLAMVLWSLAEILLRGALLLTLGAFVILNVMTIRSHRRKRTPKPALNPQWLKRRPSMRTASFSFWRCRTTITYVLVMWAVDRLLTRLGDDLHAHPGPFVLFGLTLGLGLTLLEWELRCEGARKQGTHSEPWAGGRRRDQ
jgi:hypothetical protein